MKKIHIIFSFLITLGFWAGGINPALAADANCTSAGGNCNSTPAECLKGGGLIVSGTMCTNTSYACCKPAVTAVTCGSININAMCVPPGSCDSAQNTINTTATDCSGGVCCVPNSSITTGNSQTVDFPNPIKASTMSEFLGNVLNALMGVVAFISLIFIIVGAVMYMLSAGNEQAIERAKKTITGAVVGLAIAAAAPTFLKEVKNILGGANGVNPDDIVNKAYTLKDIAINVLNFLLSVTGIVAIIGLIVGAIFYLTSYGDEDRMEKGKKILVASVIGIIVAFSALVIVRQIAKLIAA